MRLVARGSGPWGGAAWLMLQVCLPVTIVLAVVWGVVDGGHGVGGAVAGGVLGYAFFASTPAVMEPVTRRSPAGSMPVALGLYLVKVLVALVLLALLFNGSALSPAALGSTVLAVSVVCTTVTILVYRRSRIPTYRLDEHA